MDSRRKLAKGQSSPKPLVRREGELKREENTSPPKLEPKKTEAKESHLSIKEKFMKSLNSEKTGSKPKTKADHESKKPHHPKKD